MHGDLSEAACRRLKDRGLPEPIVKRNVVMRYFFQRSYLHDNLRAMRDLAEVCQEAEQVAKQLAAEEAARDARVRPPWRVAVALPWQAGGAPEAGEWK